MDKILRRRRRRETFFISREWLTKNLLCALPRDNAIRLDLQEQERPCSVAEQTARANINCLSIAMTC